MTERVQPPWWYWMTRERCLIKQFECLKASGVRNTPAVILKKDQERRQPIEVRQAPVKPGGHWILSDGRSVLTREIRLLDTGRSLAGYD